MEKIQVLVICISCSRITMLFCFAIMNKIDKKMNNYYQGDLSWEVNPKGFITLSVMFFLAFNIGNYLD